MQKPSEIKIWLADSWPIKALSIDYAQTGTDTAETRVTITGSQGRKTLKWDTVEHLLTVGVDYNSIARLNYGTAEEVAKWKAFESEHADDLAEFTRLKKKLGTT